MVFILPLYTRDASTFAELEDHIQKTISNLQAVTCEDFERSEEEEVEFGRLLTYVQVRKSANFFRTFEESEMLTSQEVYGIPKFWFPVTTTNRILPIRGI